MRIVRKSIGYITSERRILFFRASELPALGAELPGGTLEEGEAPKVGLLREVAEETGLSGFAPPRLLGVVDHYPEDLPTEVHRRHFYHLPLRGEAPEAWSRVVEEGNGTFTFNFFWADESNLPVSFYPGHDVFIDEVGRAVGWRMR